MFATHAELAGMLILHIAQIICSVSRTHAVHLSLGGACELVKAPNRQHGQ